MNGSDKKAPAGCARHILPDVSCKSCESNLHTADVSGIGSVGVESEMSLLTVKFADKCTELHNYRYK